MRPDNQYNGVIGYGGNLVVNATVQSDTDSDEAYTGALLFNGNLVTPETKSEYCGNGCYGGPQYTADELIGYYTTGKNNLVPTYRLPPGRLGEWAEYQFVNAVSDCYGNHYNLKMRLNNFSFAVQNGKKNVDTPILACFQYNRFWFFAYKWRDNNSHVGVSFDVTMTVDGAPPGKVLNAWTDLDQPSIVGNLSQTLTAPASTVPVLCVSFGIIRKVLVWEVLEQLGTYIPMK